jgi:hypothetical protein
VRPPDSFAARYDSAVIASGVYMSKLRKVVL